MLMNLPSATLGPKSKQKIFQKRPESLYCSTHVQATYLNKAKKEESSACKHKECRLSRFKAVVCVSTLVDFVVGTFSYTFM